MPKIIVPIASDHRGFGLKSILIEWLSQNGYAPEDLGSHDAERCDAFDFAQKLANRMKEKTEPFGVLICGTGHAMAMTANRFRHLRAAHCTDATMARFAREHNDANVLALGAGIVGVEVAIDCLSTFLGTEFLRGRYAERRDRLTDLGGL